MGIFLMIIPAALTVWALQRWWRMSPKVCVPVWRSYFAVGAMALVGLSELLWVGFGILVNTSRGGAYDLVLTWFARLGFFAAPAALLASLFGKGTLRWPAFSLAIVMALLWIVIGTAV